MCGIVGFLSNSSWQTDCDISWLEQLHASVTSVTPQQDNWLSATSEAIVKLEQCFDDLMEFGLYIQIISNPKVQKTLEELTVHIQIQRDHVASYLERERTDTLEHLHEKLEDYYWQLDYEVLQGTKRVKKLLMEELLDDNFNKAGYFLAWSVEQVLGNLDKLEVRGRDSAGIAIQCVLQAGTNPENLLDQIECTELKRRQLIENADSGHILIHHLDDARLVCRFLYKVANLVGQLGDNGSILRTKIREDKLLWKLVANLENVNIIAHTRWASNGIINVFNCHPVDGKVIADSAVKEGKNADVLFVINGDVDNYHTLVDASIHSRGFSISPSITTDAKVLPVLFYLDISQNSSIIEHFRTVMRRCDGSLAVIMQHPECPEELFLSQKGSGQSLYAGCLKDGWLIASETYGLAANSRSSYPIMTTENGGVSVVLSSREMNCIKELHGTYLIGTKTFYSQPEPLEIFSRDIFRGNYAYYIEKEIHDAPDSIRKTLQGKYHKDNNRISFLPGGFGNSRGLSQRLNNRDLPFIQFIKVVGQGTASIAAMGVAHLIRQALAKSDITVESAKASELFGFLADRPLNNILLIAISQSGTTTDTNRIVDLAREQGAWIHAIVNRRNSPLVRKADSYIYTSNGRDVEMSVASTKAYYSQIVAGKLMALWLATELKTMTEQQIFEDLCQLESLPLKINDVLSGKNEIARCAAKYAPKTRYWAVVGNGSNRIAAEEIRIKLSELCYKSIPCDVTEDKKHIDLSTEPLTIVVANTLPERVVQDTVKEVAIFKAHNGQPLVLCSHGETRFDNIAEDTIKLPSIGAGLGFVLATVAGHLWGIDAAKSLDKQAESFRKIRSILTSSMDNRDSWNREIVLAHFNKILDLVEAGYTDSALPSRIVVEIAKYVSWLEAQPTNISAKDADLLKALAILNRAIEEMARPIDTIRHQAKTVTVGISRPKQDISPIFIEELHSLGVKLSELKEQDCQLLETLSPLVSEIKGSILYKVLDLSEHKTNEPLSKIQAINGTGICKVQDSRYIMPRPVSGTKRKVLRLGSAVLSTGKDDQENLLILPVFSSSSGNCSHEVLMHLNFVLEASFQQKLDVLRQLGNQYDELLEQIEDLSVSVTLEDFLIKISPRDILLKSVEQLAKDQLYKER